VKAGCVAYAGVTWIESFIPGQSVQDVSGKNRGVSLCRTGRVTSWSRNKRVGTVENSCGLWVLATD